MRLLITFSYVCFIQLRETGEKAMDTLQKVCVVSNVNKSMSLSSSLILESLRRPVIWTRMSVICANKFINCLDTCRNLCFLET